MTSLHSVIVKYVADHTSDKGKMTGMTEKTINYNKVLQACNAMYRTQEDFMTLASRILDMRFDLQQANMLMATKYISTDHNTGAVAYLLADNSWILYRDGILTEYAEFGDMGIERAHDIVLNHKFDKGDAL